MSHVDDVENSNEAGNRSTGVWEPRASQGCAVQRMAHMCTGPQAQQQSAVPLVPLTERSAEQLVPLTKQSAVQLVPLSEPVQTPGAEGTAPVEAPRAAIPGPAALAAAHPDITGIASCGRLLAQIQVEPVQSALLAVDPSS